MSVLQTVILRCNSTGTGNPQTFGQARMPKGRLKRIRGYVTMYTASAGSGTLHVAITRLSAPYDYTAADDTSALMAWFARLFEAATKATDGSVSFQVDLACDHPMGKDQILYLQGLGDTTIQLDVYLVLELVT